MEIYLYDQFSALIGALVLGAALGGVYDLVRISRIFIGVRYPGAARIATYGRLAPKITRESAAMSHFLFLCGITAKRRTKKRPRSQMPSALARRGRIINLFRWLGVFAGDLIYFTFSGVAFCIFIHFSGGEFRFFMLVGLAVGFFAYYLTLGRAVIRVSGFIVRTLRIGVSYAIYAIARPGYLSILFVWGIFFFIFEKIMLISRQIYVIIYIEKFSSHKKRVAECAILAGLP